MAPMQGTGTSQCEAPTRGGQGDAGAVWTPPP